MNVASRSRSPARGRPATSSTLARSSGAAARSSSPSQHEHGHAVARPPPRDRERRRRPDAAGVDARRLAALAVVHSPVAPQRRLCHAPDRRAERGSLRDRAGRAVTAFRAGVLQIKSIMGSEQSPHAFVGAHERARASRSTDPVAARHSARTRAMPMSSDVRLTLPARPENVAVIRHVLGAFAEALRLPADLVEDMRLAVTEACTNVVRHAYDDDEPGPIDVVIRPDGDALELIVSDHGRGIGPSPDIAGPGLGLPLIAALADARRDPARRHPRQPPRDVVPVPARAGGRVTDARAGDDGLHRLRPARGPDPAPRRRHARRARRPAARPARRRRARGRPDRRARARAQHRRQDQRRARPGRPLAARCASGRCARAAARR